MKYRQNYQEPKWNLQFEYFYPTSKYIYIYFWVIYAYTYICMYVFVCVCLCIYIYIYFYVHFLLYHLSLVHLFIMRKVHSLCVTLVTWAPPASCLHTLPSAGMVVTLLKCAESGSRRCIFCLGNRLVRFHLFCGSSSSLQAVVEGGNVKSNR